MEIEIRNRIDRCDWILQSKAMPHEVFHTKIHLKIQIHA